MSAVCTHLDQVALHELPRVRRRLRGLPARRHQVAAPPDLPHLRPRRLLRRLARAPRHRALPLDVAPDHPLARARRGMELVLHRRGRLHHRRRSRHDADPALAAAVVTAVRELPAIAAALERARDETLKLLEPLDDDMLLAQVSPIMSPLVWDLAHIGWFEELWLLRRGGGEPALEGFDDLYDAFRHERAERSSLPILKPAEARAYLESVRRQDARGARGRLLCERPRPAARAAAPGDDAPDVAALRRRISGAASRRPATGARDRGRARPGRPVQPRYERPVVGLRQRAAGARRRAAGVPDRALTRSRTSGSWSSSRTAATGNGATGATRGGAGCRRRALEHRSTGSAAAKAGCDNASDSSSRCRRASRFSTSRSTRPKPSRPGQTSGSRRKRSGRKPRKVRTRRANLGRTSFGPLPVTPHATSLLGDVWEWTSSPFTGYPGFEAFPYAEYSEVFFGDEHRVLRGGSWATDPLVARVTFRNWDLPSAAATVQRRATGVRRMSAIAETAVLFSPADAQARTARGGAARADLDPEGAAAQVVLRPRAARSCSRRSPGCPSTT